MGPAPVAPGARASLTPIMPRVVLAVGLEHGPAKEADHGTVASGHSYPVIAQPPAAGFRLGLRQEHVAHLHGGGVGHAVLDADHDLLAGCVAREVEVAVGESKGHPAVAHSEPVGHLLAH